MGWIYYGRALDLILLFLSKAPNEAEYLRWLKAIRAWMEMLSPDDMNGDEI